MGALVVWARALPTSEQARLLAAEMRGPESIGDSSTGSGDRPGALSGESHALS